MSRMNDRHDKLLEKQEENRKKESAQMAKMQLEFLNIINRSENNNKLLVDMENNLKEQEEKLKGQEEKLKEQQEKLKKRCIIS